MTISETQSQCRVITKRRKDVKNQGMKTNVTSWHVSSSNTRLQTIKESLMRDKILIKAVLEVSRLLFKTCMQDKALPNHAPLPPFRDMHLFRS